MEDCVVVSPDMFTPASDLYKAFCDWREREGVKLDLSSQALTKRLKLIEPALVVGDAARVNGIRGLKGMALRGPQA
jgi:hypothetical protein